MQTIKNLFPLLLATVATFLTAGCHDTNLDPKFLYSKSIADKFVIKTSQEFYRPGNRLTVRVNLAERTTLENVNSIGEYLYDTLDGESMNDFVVWFYGPLAITDGSAALWARWDMRTETGELIADIAGWSKQEADSLYNYRFPKDWQVLSTGVIDGIQVVVVYKNRNNNRFYIAKLYPDTFFSNEAKRVSVQGQIGYRRKDNAREIFVPIKSGLKKYDAHGVFSADEYPPIEDLKPAFPNGSSTPPLMKDTKPTVFKYPSVTPRLDITDDGQYFAFQPSETSIATVNLQSGEIINTEEYDAPIRHFHFNKDNLLAAQTIDSLHPLTAFSNGKLVVTLLSEDKLGVLDIAQGKVISQSDLHGEVEAIRISPSNTMALLAYKDVLHLISWGGDGSVLKLTELEAYSGENVTSFEFSRDSKILAIANTSNEIHLVSTHDGVIENTITGFNTANCMTFLSGNDVLLVGQINGSIVQHTISTNASVQLSNQLAGSPITNIVINPEETKCILVQENGKVNVLAIKDDN
tara:strand:- start:289 stop:1854 length:1566 start_codon:yes stop_codon:yes gene_type:complete